MEAQGQATESAKAHAAAELQKRVNACYEGDVCKPACVPLATLGQQMISRIPLEKLRGDVLVISDLGLLVSTCKVLHKNDVAMTNVTFIAHSEKVAAFARDLDVNVNVILYEKLGLFFSGKGDYTCLKMKFDVIVGNPPFQPEIQKKGNEAGSANKIWPKFIELAFELANEDAHIVMVTPANWRNGYAPKSQHAKVTKIIWERSIENVTDTRNPFDHFPDIGHSLKVDAWHVINSFSPGKVQQALPKSLVKKCLIPDQRDAVSLSILDKYFRVCETCQPIETIDRDGLKKQTHVVRGKEGDDIHRYKVANTSAQTKKGQFDWVSKEPRSFSLKKVLISDSGALDPFYDAGACAAGNHYHAYLVDGPESGKLLIDFLTTFPPFLIRFFVQEGAFSYPYHLIERLPRELLTKTWHEVFDLTQEEIGHIVKLAQK